ncbi:hypothetical protein [Defluviimonas sp. SAOS-178_SWC]|uniref:hypothetical protein n=1 Tax=Defluviimonas sp. SAOS-178_SWC TaxID=3121287 RepID=UPI0032213B6F
MSFFKAPLAAGFVVGAVLGGSEVLAQSMLTDTVEDWLASPHANRASPAFKHWNEDGQVAPECANCHSSEGLVDFLGGDGSPAGVVDQPVATGLAIDEVACHSRVAAISIRAKAMPDVSHMCRTSPIARVATTPTG